MGLGYVMYNQLVTYSVAYRRAHNIGTDGKCAYPTEGVRPPAAPRGMIKLAEKSDPDPWLSGMFQ